MTRTLLCAALAAAVSLPAPAQTTGPSTSVPPYLVPSVRGVELTSILSVGDAVGPGRQGEPAYRMVGSPDGLGAYDNGDGTISVLMNHELGDTAGAVRAHGGKGAFVSRWRIRKSDLRVLGGEDLITKAYLWSGSGHVETANASFSRFCSADLPPQGAFFNPATGLGYKEGRIFMNGEETGPSGRAFAHVFQDGGPATSWELPRLGRLSWENAVASPLPQDLTVVAGLDDGGIGTSKAHFYVGRKAARGSPIERAGLTNGVSYQLVIAGIGATENGIEPADRRARAFSLANSGGTGFNRIEDGAWDTRNPNVFYFATTASFSTNSRLWKLTFGDIRKPQAGGTIEVLIDGALDGPKMLDNLTVDSGGNLILQEDTGRQPHAAKLWQFNPATRALRELAAFDPARFTPGEAGFITQDEESSGVIEVTDLFAGVAGYDAASFRYFLLDAQVHKNISATEPELVELGQLLLMKLAR